ncbi:MAG TPA: 50S ribosomal protein L25 [Kiritimatiellia bacterium]|nr:50S ribosomal protein L25 [Kiritimatiellia bacterium]HMO98854.1 50S ribosomal protein L25 [Kiritimatiellia bacterium]HMP97275.1 50S ribosomal protein L25 [Kiritimatiellia bacterium]
MAQSVKVNALPRAEKGSSISRRLRRSGFFPGVVYGAGKSNQMVQVNEHEFRKSLHGHSSEHVLLDLDIQGQSPIKVLLQEVQHNSLTGQITHADFHEVSMTEKLRVEVRVELVGIPVGVTQGGGVLEHLLREVEIECLPGDLMEEIKVDVSGLGVGDNLTVADIQLDASKYEIITHGELPVAMVASPTVEEEKPAEGAATAEPEVIKEKKPAEEAKA